MHILFILDYYKPHLGGSETVFFNIIERLKNKGYTIDIITCLHDKKLPSIEKNGLETIHRVGTNRKNFMILALLYGRKLIKQNPSIKMIHSTTYAGAIPSSILSTLCKKPVLLTVHEVFGKLRDIYKPFPLNIIYKQFEKKIFKKSYSHFHCVSLYTFNSLRLLYGIPDNKMTVIHNGIDPSRSPSSINSHTLQQVQKKFNLTASGLSGFKFTLLYYGHSGKSKGLDFLVSALPALIKQNPGLQVIINLIDAKRDTEMKNNIKNLKLKPNVVLLDGLPEEELKHLVSAVDAVIAPSLSEGFGSVHTETVAMGTDLITTPIGPLPEVLRGKVHRIKPQSSDSIITTVSALIKGKQVKPIPTKNFNRDTTVTELEKIYKNLVK